MKIGVVLTVKNHCKDAKTQKKLFTFVRLISIPSLRDFFSFDNCLSTNIPSLRDFLLFDNWLSANISSLRDFLLSGNLLSANILSKRDCPARDKISVE